MDLRNLHSFVTVVEHGSLAEAARRLDLTAGAVAARIAALEQEVGVPLVQRSGRFVTASQAGLSILERSRAVLRDVRDLQAVACGSAMPGELRLGMLASGLSDLLPSVLESLYARHPALNVFVAPGISVDLYRKVVAGDLDAAILVEPQFALAKHCEWAAIAAAPMVLVVPSRLAGSDAHALLQSEPFIRYDRSVVGGQMADRYLRDHGLRPQQRLELDGMMAIAAVVGRGLGVSLLPDWAPLWQAGLPIRRIKLPGNTPVHRVGVLRDTRGPRAVLAGLVLDAARTAWKRLAGADGSRRTRARPA